MDETVTVRFGITSARELEIEVEPGHDIAKEFENALSAGTQLLWISDALGHRHGIVMGKVAFIEVESATKRDVGFGSET
ncbi:MAG: DUF3107 family protein [Actinobacteria bacterium]|nr:DUF3107 family protein [Actinomycetota bacterium]